MATNAALVSYTSGATTTIPIANGQTLDVILKNIDAAINTHNTAPDYSGYNLYCIKQVDGTSHPTNTQNFAEGISKNLCDFHTTYTTFTGTTYPAAIGTLTTAVNGLQVPGITYSPFSIVNTDTITQVLNKNFAGITTVTNSITPAAANWSTITVSPSPSTIVGAFNSVIAFVSALSTTVSGKQSTIANIDNSGNCLSGIGGTNNDTIRATTLLLITYACSLPSYTTGSITWGGVSPGTTLQNSIQSIVNTSSSLLTNTVQGAGTGLVISSIGSTYQGKKLSIDPTYTTLYKSMVDSSDTTADFLGAKLVAGTGITIAVQNTGANETLLISNTITATSQVKVNSSDTTSGYLSTKIPSTNDQAWGLSLTAAAGNNNSILNLTPSLGNPLLFFQNEMTYIANNPTLLKQFAGLVALSVSAPGTPISNLVVTLNSPNFGLAWTHQSGSAQNAKFRQYGQQAWVLFGFITPNPMTGTAATNAIPAPAVNFVYEFQVDTVYPTGTIGSNIYQMIDFFKQTATYTVTSGIISVNQSPMQIDTIQYRLKNGGGTVIQNVATTGAIPNVSFTTVSAGSYTVEYRYGTLVNGATLFSDDASQLGGWFTLAVTV